jgi:hypothetical protein
MSIIGLEIAAAARKDARRRSEIGRLVEDYMLALDAVRDANRHGKQADLSHRKKQSRVVAAELALREALGL